MTPTYLCYCVSGISSVSSRRITTKTLRRGKQKTRHYMPSKSPSYLAIINQPLLLQQLLTELRCALKLASQHRPARASMGPVIHRQMHQNQSIHFFWISWIKTITKGINDKTAIRNCHWISSAVFDEKTPISSHCPSDTRQYWVNDNQQPLHWPHHNAPAWFIPKIARTMVNRFWPISLVANIWTPIHHPTHSHHRQPMQIKMTIVIVIVVQAGARFFLDPDVKRLNQLY